MAKHTILLVEDEKPIREMVFFALDGDEYKVVDAVNGRQASEYLNTHTPDLILMDWMLPDVSGLEMVRRIKRDEVLSSIPVIMLTAKTEEQNKVEGLDAGADDYITKPFSVKELSARIRAAIRRSGSNDKNRLSNGVLILDLDKHTILINDNELDAGPTEFKLLEFFMSHPEKVYSRAQLLDFVWGRSKFVEERTVDVHILRLRKLLKPHGCDKMIQTVRGYGYLFLVA
ncbi:MAG: phosphate regulon transcriptional regulator PhoB [Gammaproteobacteria bacterium]|nr:phosphate regulon transcriptional regulator PhoB [Gammaproteobacteria bacterium]